MTLQKVGDDALWGHLTIAWRVVPCPYICHFMSVTHFHFNKNHNREICIAVFQHPFLTALYRKFKKMIGL